MLRAESPAQVMLRRLRQQYPPVSRQVRAGASPDLEQRRFTSILMTETISGSLRDKHADGNRRSEVFHHAAGPDLTAGPARRRAPPLAPRTPPCARAAPAAA